MNERIAHVGIAVKNLENSIAIFSRLFNQPPDHLEEVKDQHVRIAMFRAGENSIELLEATTHDSSIATFLEKRGEGVHHVALVVDNILEELKRLQQSGFQLVDETPRLGADGYLVAFLHPKSTNGVLIELSQKIRP
jgi:methylmalonyl-CoA/ethylmalonyl-CoA epimerase